MMRHSVRVQNFLQRLSQIWITPKHVVKQLCRWITLLRRKRRVPVLLQLNSAECGAACLAMILSYYGRATSVAMCRGELGGGRDGASALKIVKVARNQGLRVKAFSVDIDDFRYISCPAIAHWGFNHFVIVERWSPRYIDIVDPSIGRRRITLTMFKEAFTGVVLTFEPGMHFVRRAMPKRQIWRHYLDYIMHTPGVLIQIVGASFLLQLFGLAVPITTQILVDRVIPFQMTSVMSILGLGMLILLLAHTVITYLRSALLIYLQARLDANIMVNFFEHLLSLPFRFFAQRTSGDLLMRFNSNLLIRETLTSQTLSIILDGLFVVVYLIILFLQFPIFGLLVLVIGSLQIGLLFLTYRRVHRLMQSNLLAQAETQSYVVEALDGVATLKASGVEERVFDHWSNLFFKQMNTSLQRNQLSAFIDTGLIALRTLAPLALLWIGALWVLDGTMTLGTMLALNALALAFLTPLGSLVLQGQQLQLIGAYLERIGDVLEATPEQSPHDDLVQLSLTGRIDLQHISFRYEPDAPWVLQDLSFAITPGQKIALVGHTGSGKSTLAQLLLGLYAPTEGTIHYDGIPIEQINYQTLRSQFGVVLQEPFVFSGSLRSNIAFNNPDMPFEQVVEAAQLAALHEDIKKMPMGYETIISEGGSGLSGGQRQRLALARALARKPSLLVLDEATSHLDTETERQVDKHISQLNCTRIVIAHRLSTIRNADLILVLEQGQIVERGTHDELLTYNGIYADLVGLQANMSDKRQHSI